MKLKNGKRWYVGELDNYTSEFLAEIIKELWFERVEETYNEDIKNLKQED